MDNQILMLPNGEGVDVVEDLAVYGSAAGFDYEHATLDSCADFLACWYGDPDEELQALISRGDLAWLILLQFTNVITLDQLQTK